MTNMKKKKLISLRQLMSRIKKSLCRHEYSNESINCTVYNGELCRIAATCLKCGKTVGIITTLSSLEKTAQKIHDKKEE